MLIAAHAPLRWISVLSASQRDRVCCMIQQNIRDKRRCPGHWLDSHIATRANDAVHVTVAALAEGIFPWASSRRVCLDPDAVYVLFTLRDFDA